jgi:plastocyanin
MTGIRSALLFAALLALAAGCGDDKKKKDGDSVSTQPAAGGDAKAPAGGGGSYDAAKSTASVKFSVKWAGAAPAQKEVPITEAVCKDHKAMDPRYEVGAGGGLPHSFVWAATGPHKGMTGYPAAGAFTLDQKGCMYVPHVFGVRAGQTFTVKNSDGTKHNVHAKPGKNKEINQSQDKDQKNEFVFAQQEKAIPFNCDVHPWMSATAFVLEHPFYGTTGADGMVEIKGLPAGDYTFRVWHEQFSGEKPYEQEVKVTLKDGESKDVPVEFK